METYHNAGVRKIFSVRKAFTSEEYKVKRLSNCWTNSTISALCQKPDGKTQTTVISGRKVTVGLVSNQKLSFSMELWGS